MDIPEQELALAAYEAHLPAARALPAGRVLEYRLNPDRAIFNVKRSMQVLDRLGDEIPRHLPQISVTELSELPSLALAVKMSAMLAKHPVVDATSPREMIAEGWKLRATLMPVVAGLAATGAIPREVYEHILRGRGTRDMAADCVALSRVFSDYDVAGKHGVAPELIDRAELVGSWLLQNLRAKHARRRVRHRPEVEIRDRMATLLVERYKKMRAVAYYFYFDDFAEHAPPLMSRHVPRKREPAAQSSVT